MEDQECTKENGIFSDSLLDTSSEGPGGIQHIQWLNSIAALGLGEDGLADWFFFLEQQKGMIILLEIPPSQPVETLLAGLEEVTHIRLSMERRVW